MSKKCSTCKQELPPEEFNTDRSRKDGLDKQCRKCFNIRQSKYRHSAKGRQVQQKYYRQNKGKLSAYAKEYRKARLSSFRNKALLRRYDITLKQHKQMYLDQNGCCVLCRDSVPYDKIHTDHDHATGKVRGLLCCRCNMGLGFWKDSVESLYQAIAYLESTE